MRKTKIASKDYTISMLPQTRKAVFFDVVHLQWKNLILLGLILALFYVPVLIATATRDLMQSGIYLSAQNEDLVNAKNGIIFLQVAHGILLIPLMAVFSVALSGALRIIRQYAWEENVHLTTDFAKGIRNNYRQTAAICCLAGLIYTLCILVYHSASAYQNSALSLFSLLPIGISAMVVLPVFAIALAMIPVYSNTLFQALKNAFYVYCRSLLKVLLATVCCLLPWVPALIPNFYCHILGGLLGIVLTPFILLGWNLFCYNRFDTHINPQVCPELIGKGTFPADKNNIL